MVQTDFPLQAGKAPEPRRNVARPRKYPFHDMKPGQMFFAPGARPNTMMSLASSTGRRLGWTFATRQKWMKLNGKLWQDAVASEKDAQQGMAVYRIK